MPFPFMAAAIIGSTILGVGATVYAGSKAAAAQEKGASEAIDTQWKMFQQQREDFAPWREAGERALGTLEEQIAAGPGEFDPKETPGYEFGFKNFIEEPYLGAASAKGRRLSSGTIKDLTKYAQDYAETSYDTFLRRYQQKLNPLQGMAGVGVTAAGGQAEVTGAAGSNIANLQYQNALSQGNIQTGMAAGVAGTAQNAMQQYMNYQIMQKMGVTGGGDAGGSSAPAYSSSVFRLELQHEGLGVR